MVSLGMHFKAQIIITVRQDCYYLVFFLQDVLTCRAVNQYNDPEITD